MSFVFSKKLSRIQRYLLAVSIFLVLLFFSLSAYASLNSNFNTEADKGSVWISGSEIHWSDGSTGYWIEDPEKVSDFSDRSRGDWWIEGDYMHWVDYNGEERRYKGPKADTNTESFKGDVWIKEGFLHYIDSSGNERITCWDKDEDGYFSESCGGTDCDESKSSINPGATDLCNGIDDDCDGTTDENSNCDRYPNSYCSGESGCKCNPDDYCSSGSKCGTESDGCGGEISCGECGAGERCDESTNICVCQDNDGDGYKDSACGGQDCDDSNEYLNPETTWYKDEDGDNYYGKTKKQCSDPGKYWTRDFGSDRGGDCDDYNSNINPETLWYKDADGDNYYSKERNQCNSPGDDWTMNSGEGGGDCDDEKEEVNPGDSEICNDIDDDCDEEIDEGNVCNSETGDDDDVTPTP